LPWRCRAIITSTMPKSDSRASLHVTNHCRFVLEDPTHNSSIRNYKILTFVKSSHVMLVFLTGLMDFDASTFFQNLPRPFIVSNWINGLWRVYFLSEHVKFIHCIFSCHLRYNRCVHMCPSHRYSLINLI